MTGGILSDAAISRAILDGEIRIDPFEPAQLNPVSYDLTLGDEVRLYSKWVRGVHRFDVNEEDGSGLVGDSYEHDVKEEPKTLSYKIHPVNGWLLKPGIGYLMHTRERIHTKFFVPVLDGKSSIGRLFMKVHETAGYGDPGFDGQYTLEVTVQHPLRVYAGMRIAQIRFHSVHGVVGKVYAGQYRGNAATGAVASRAWKQFT